MSQMDSSITMMLKGLEGMTKAVDGMVTKSMEDMPAEDAIKFAKQLEESKLSEQMNEATKGLKEIKQMFNL